MKMLQLQIQEPTATRLFPVYVGTKNRHAAEPIMVRRSVILRGLLIAEDGSVVLQRGEYILADQ
jgi:hypothetical protein